MSNLKPSRAQFTKWLTDKGSRKVGFRAVCDECPVANYYKAAARFAGLEVAYITVEEAVTEIGLWDEKSITYRNPPWMRKFIKAVDSDPDTFRLTGRKALKLLEAI